MNKKEEKWLKEQCKKLEVESYKAFHKYREPVKENSDRNGDPGFMLKTGFLDDHEVNHFRRCKGIYKSGGIEELTKYFNKRGFKIEKRA